MSNTEEAILYNFITPNLAIGPISSRNDPQFGAIVTCLSLPEISFTKTGIYPLHTDNVLYLPFRDNELGITEHLTPAIEFISKEIQTHKVLVHCFMGISRSTSIVISYLMSEGMDYYDAYNLVREKRDVMNPYGGFTREIIEYFQEKKRVDKPLPPHIKGAWEL